MFYLQDRYEEALKWYMQALEGYKMSCGSSHPQALVSFYNVASAHLGNENYKEAREKFEIAVVGQRKVLGLEHPDTVKTEKAITYTEEIMAAHDSKE
jgi:tetratricopeptide (TPR) repeat protein